MNNFIQVQNAEMVFNTKKGRFHALREIDLTVAKGEFVTLIGHSGCGKSTLLNLVAGLTRPSEGTILLADKHIDGPGPDRGVVFQAPNLLSWLSARQNVALGVDRVYPHASNGERADIVDYYLTRVGLADSLDKLARDMSNGMRQRVGLALEQALVLLTRRFSYA